MRHLANGGMGVIFEAEHVATEARVALKVLWPHVLQSTHARQRFELEAKVSARVDSDHIVRVLDAGFEAESGLAYLVMELLVGSTLGAYVSAAGALSASSTVLLMRQVAQGLDAAHGYRAADGAAQPIVHRDLKPENLFLCTRRDGAPLVKILDFGIAKVLRESASVSQDLRGTPAYMAYEQLAGKTLSPQTDIWSLGLITYYVLTGRAYFRAANEPLAEMHALFAEILTLPLTRASVRMREDGVDIVLPRAFDAWLFGCIAREPTRRFRSAGEAISALELVLLPGRRRDEAGDAQPRLGAGAHLAYASTAILDAVPAAPTASSHSVGGVASERRHSSIWRRTRSISLMSGVLFVMAAALTWYAHERTERQRLWNTPAHTTAQQTAPNERPSAYPSNPREVRSARPAPTASSLPPLSPPSPAPTSRALDAGAESPSRAQPEGPRAAGQRPEAPDPPPRAPVQPRARRSPPNAPVEPGGCDFDPYTGQCADAAPEP